MKLLIELINEVQYTLDEKEGHKPSLWIEGVYLQSEIKNKNGRIYPKGIMEEAVSKYIVEKVKGGVAYGELSHPAGPQINPDRVCHRITELNWSGNDVIGKSKVGGPLGESVAKLMELGGKIGVSSRGLGSLKAYKAGIMEVQNDFKIATAADVVLDPSAPDAYVKGVMEDTEWFMVNGVWAQRTAERAIDEIKGMTKRQLQEAKVRVFNRFLSHITGDLHEGMKLIKTHTNGSDSAKVYRDSEWGEFRVQYYKDGQHRTKADSHHDDAADAHSTAQHVLKQGLK